MARIGQTEWFRQGRATVREILRRDWNPIGLDDLPEDEYDSYADMAHAMLAVDGRSVEDVGSYLDDIAEHIIEMPTGNGLIIARILAAALDELGPRPDTA